MIPSSCDSSRGVSKCSRVKPCDMKRKPSFRKGEMLRQSEQVSRGREGRANGGFRAARGTAALTHRILLQGRIDATEESKKLHRKVIATWKCRKASKGRALKERKSDENDLQMI